MTFFGQARTGVREEPGTYTKGKYTKGTTSVINFNASVQPIRANEQETLPEGLREEGSYKLYTNFQLRAVNQTTKEPGDIVDLFGKKYRVVFLEPWQNNLCNHYKAIVSEIDDD